MNKKRTLWILLDLIFPIVFNLLFPIVFNLVFFMAGGTEHPVSVWISYGFIHFAYLMFLITPFLTRKSSYSAVLEFPLFYISSIYFIVTLVVGLIFILIHPQSYQATLYIQVILTAIYAVMLISHLIANENTVDNSERHEIELRYINGASSKLKGIMDSISDNQLRKKVERLYDLLHSSPVKSNNSVRDYELTVLELIDTLERNVNGNDIPAAEDTISKIEKNAGERNRRLKYGI